VPLPFRLYAILDNPNVFGVVLALTIPAAIGYAFWTSRRWERIAAVALLMGMGWALLATGSRGSQLATVAGVAGTLIGVGLARGWPQMIRHNRRAQLNTMAVIGASVVLIGGALFIESRGAGRGGSEARHFDLWRTAIQAGVTHPVFGIGPGGFAAAQLQSVSAPPTPVERHAHNLYLNFFAENGVLGSIALIVWLLLMVNTIRYVWRAVDMTNRFWLSGLVGGLIAFGAAGMLDDPMAQMAPLTIMTLFTALIVSAAPMPKPRTNSLTKFVPWSILTSSILICALAIWFTTRYATVWNAAQNNPNNSAQAWTTTAQVLDQAAANDPADALTITQAAVAWVEVTTSGVSSEALTAVLDKAIVDYQRVVSLDPVFAIHHLNLGTMLLQRGSLVAAIAELAKAVQMAPTSGITHLNYAVALEQAGRIDLAVTEYKQALMLGIARSPLFWQATALRRSVPAITPAAITADDTPRALISGLAALSRGDTPGARYEFTAAITLGGGDAATSAMIALGDLNEAQGNNSGALDQYRAAFSRIDRYGELGPGHTGDQTYAVNALGRFAYISDYVPAVLTLDITPERAARFVTLAKALTSAGDYTAAAHIYRRVLIDNPGYSAAEAGLSQLGMAG
jgi:tetratricopeptide (TPR) repeat protein